MKTIIKFRPAKIEETFWTGRVGTVFATYDELVEKFGEPHNRTKEGKWESRDGKTRFEWAFILDGDNNKGIVLTVYDYKNNQPKEEIREWSLGCRKKDELIEEFLYNMGVSVKM